MEDIMVHFDTVYKAVKEGIAAKIPPPPVNTNVVYLPPVQKNPAQW